MKSSITITVPGGPVAIVSPSGSIRVGEYNPENGTNYKAVAISWPSEEDFNALGSIDAPGWLVINCNTKLSHLFRAKGLLTNSYIKEKLGGSKGDYPYFGDLVRKLIFRELEDKKS